MTQVFFVLWHLCTLRGNTGSVPYHPTFLALVVVATMATDAFFRVANGEVPSLQSILQSLASYAVVAVLVRIALQFVEEVRRFIQTFTAFMGTELILHVLLLAFLIIIPSALFQMIAVAFSIWRIVIFGVILRDALNQSTPIGILSAFAILIIATLASYIAFGPPPQ